MDPLEDLRQNYASEMLDMDDDFDRSPVCNRRLTLSWEQAQSGLLYIARPSLTHPEDCISLPAVGHVERILEYFDPTTGLLRPIRRQELNEWNVSRNEVDATAEHNMALLLCGRFFRMHEEGTVRYATLDGAVAPSSASFCLCSYFRQEMKSVFGFPCYVALPSRDTLRIFCETSLSTIGAQCADLLDDYHHNRYPITTEVLEITEAGIRVFKDLKDWH